MADEVVLTDENIPPMQDELFRLYSQGFLTDITLSCEDGKNFEAHRVLLAARSQYFYAIVPKLKVEPVIFLKGVKGSHLEKVLKYIYSGSAIVSRSQLKYVLEVARSLQVKGLQDLAPTELSRGTNTSFQGHSNYAGSKTSSPIPSKGKDDAYHGKLSPRDVALQQQQKLYDKISLSSKKSPLGKSNANPQFSPGKKSKQSPSKDSSKVIKDDDNGEEIFKFQYQYISDDSEDMDRDDSNDSDFEVADKKNSKDLQVDLNSKKKRGRPVKGLENVSTFKKRQSHGKDDSDTEFRSSRKSSKSSTDDDSENSSDLDQDDSDSESEADSDDASGSDEEEEDRGSRMSHLSSSQAKVESQRSGKNKDNYYEAAPAPPPASASQSPRRGRGPSINGKQILAVQCKGKRGELFLSKFGNGTNGKSIRYKGKWMTPEDYELACGVKAKKYLESITTDYGPLKTLTASGLLKPCPKKCKCNVCLDEVITSPEAKQSLKRRDGDPRTNIVNKSDSVKESDKLPVKKRDGSPLTNYSESDHKKRKHGDGDSDVKSRNPGHSQVSRQLPSKSSSGRDKLSYSKSLDRSEHSSSKPAASTNSPGSKPASSLPKYDIISPATLSSTKTISTSVSSSPTVSTSSTFSPASSKALASPSFIAMTPVTSLNSLPSPLATVTSASIPSTGSFASKFPSASPGTPQSSAAVTTSQTSASAVISSPPSQASFQTSLTPSSTPLSMNSSSVTPKSASRPQAPTSAAQAVTKQPPVSLAMGPPAGHKTQADPQPQTVTNMAASPAQTGHNHGHSLNVSPMSHHVSAHTQLHQHQQQHLQQQQHGAKSAGHGRLGSVMQVRCKSVTALLYVAKYESGSKGKCILVNEEWMTPNEFEEKAGSKAKKYLSSIKCLGRPLRHYVNSGDLRGSGPAPSPKPPKINKPKPPQPIAPAPAPGQSPSSGYTLPPPGMSPAPGAHMSASMPQSLTQVAMMTGGGSVAHQPILLGQSNLAVSLAGQSTMNQVGTQILQTGVQPMTFTFAPMSMQGQQLGHQQLQHQQLHGSADYILQPK